MKKLTILALLTLVCLGLICSAIPTTSALGSEITGISTFGFNSSQQCSESFNGLDVYVMDRTIVCLDDTSGDLLRSYTIASFGGSCDTAIAAGRALEYKSALIKINSTHCIVATDIYWNGGGSPTQYNYIQCQTAYYNVYTNSYTIISGTGISSAVQFATNGGSATYWYNVSTSSVMLFKYISPSGNGTVSYYLIVNAQRWYSSGYSMEYLYKIGWNDGEGNFNEQVIKLRDAITPACIWDSNVYIQSGESLYIFSSNNFLGAGRANVFKVVINPTFSWGYIATTGVDASWASNLANTGGNGPTYLPFTGFLYVLGTSWAYGTGCNQLIVAFNDNLGTETCMEVITWNDTYLTQTVSRIGLNSQQVGVVARPFTGSIPALATNTSALINGQYAYAVFNSALTGNTSRKQLTGFVYDIQNLGSTEPTITTIQMFTTWSPQSMKFTVYGTSTNLGGFQRLGSGAGFYYDYTNGNQGAGKLTPDSFINLVPDFTYNGMINGDIYHNTVMATHPTVIYLKQGVSYTYIGNIFVNYILSQNGNYTVRTSGMSSSITTFLNPSYESTTTGGISNGQFQFTIAPRSMSTVVYQVMKVSFVTDTGIYAEYVYDIAFTIGGYGDAFINPTTNPSGYYGGDINPDGTHWGTGNTSDMGLFFVYFLLIFLPPIAFGAILGSATRSGMGAVIGFVGGLVLMITIGVIIGFIPFWAVIIIGCMLVCFAVLLLRGMA